MNHNQTSDSAVNYPQSSSVPATEGTHKHSSGVSFFRSFFLERPKEDSKNKKQKEEPIPSVQHKLFFRMAKRLAEHKMKKYNTSNTYGGRNGGATGRNKTSSHPAGYTNDMFFNGAAATTFFDPNSGDNQHQHHHNHHCGPHQNHHYRSHTPWSDSTTYHNTSTHTSYHHHSSGGGGYDWGSSSGGYSGGGSSSSGGGDSGGSSSSSGGGGGSSS